MNLNRYNSIIWAAIGSFILGAMLLGSAAWVFSWLTASHIKTGEIKVAESEGDTAATANESGEFVQFGFPAKLRTSDHLVIPLGINKVSEGKGERALFGAVSGGSFSYSASYRNWNQDNINNFIFRSADGKEERLLLNQKAFIKYHLLDFMYDEEDSPREDVTVGSAGIAVPEMHLFAIAESDSNGDGLINADDLATLYLSDALGLKLTKLTPDSCGFVEQSYLKLINRLYIKTVERIAGKTEEKNDTALIRLLEVDLSAPGTGREVISPDKKAEIEKLLGVR